MIGHSVRIAGVPVAGGEMHVAVWDPTSAPTADVLVIHGVSSSHLAWPFVVDRLPGVRVVAPDLRGRGRSNSLTGPAGMRAHAADLVAVLDALRIDRVVVVGHSMGGFVAVVLAHLYPERVSRLVLVDGGLPLDVPPGLDTDALVAGVLGPTAARLSMRFDGTEDYFEFWRRHPAFHSDWSPELERYLEYDLVSDGEGRLRSATSYDTVADDTVDMNTGTALSDALAGLAHPTTFLTVPRGLQDESPGLYSSDYLKRLLPTLPPLRHIAVDDLNHYTIVLSERGADAVATVVQSELSKAVASSEVTTAPPTPV